MEESPTKNAEDGPLAVWKMFNSPTISLFTNITEAQEGLKALLFSIVNSSRDFPEVLVHRSGSVCPVEYYKAFNQWLLGRIVYVLSVEELRGIHSLSIDAQLKILSILYFNEVSFFHSFVKNYVSTLEVLITYGDTDEQRLILKQFDVDTIDDLKKSLDLSPILIEIRDKQSRDRMIVHVLNILSRIFGITLGRASEENFWITAFDKFLFILENFQMELKLHSFRYYMDTVDKLGYPTFLERYEESFLRFLSMAEVIFNKLLLTFETSVEYTKFFEVFCILLKSLFVNVEKSGLKHKRMRDIISNICMIFLKYANIPNKGVFPEDLNVAIGNCFATCVEYGSAIERAVIPDNSDMLDLSPIIISKISNEIRCYLLTYDKTIDKGAINLKDITAIYSKITKLLHRILQAMSLATIDAFVVKTHLNSLNKIFNIILMVKYKTSNDFNNIKFQFFDESTVSSVSKTASKILELHAPKCDSINPAILKMLTVFVSISPELSGVIMKILTELWFMKSGKEDIEHQTMEITTINTLYFLVSDDIGKKRLKERCTKLMGNMSSKLKTVQIMMIEQSPLLLINNILTPSSMVSEYWHPALLSRNPDILKTLVEVLPAIICILANNYNIYQTQSDISSDTTIFKINNLHIKLQCSVCHDNVLYESQRRVSLRKCDSLNTNMLTSMKSLLEKFLNVNMYSSVPDINLSRIILAFSKHAIFPLTALDDLCSKTLSIETISAIKYLISSVLVNSTINDQEKDTTTKTVIDFLVASTKSSLMNDNRSDQNLCLEAIKEFGLIESENVILPSTRLLMYFVIHPRCTLGSKAAIYIVEICEHHKTPPNKIFQRFKNDYCRTMMELAAFNFLNKRGFAASILTAARAFGYIGFRDFVSKELDYALPFLIPLIVRTSLLKPIMEEIASLVNSTPTVATLLTKHFPDIYPRVYMNEEDANAAKCFKYIEKSTGVPLVIHVKKHFRIILAEILLQYCSNPEKVIKACKWLSQNDPEYSVPIADTSNIKLEQIADFLQPRFLGVLAYLDNKLVNSKVPLSSKRKALQSLPDIIKLMGPDNMTPLRFKLITTLRTALTKEFPKLNALAWSAFIHNIDTVTLGPLLTTIFVSLMPLLPYAGSEVNKIFQYLVINNENLLSANIPDLFFLENTLVSDKVKFVVKKHLQRVQSDTFIEKLSWYLPHLNQDCGKLRLYTLDFLNKLLQNSRKELDSAIFGAKEIHPNIVNLLDSLISACSETDERLRLAGGRCLGQLGAIEPGHLPRRYVSPDSAPFAFSIDEDCFASASLTELTRAFQLGKYSKNIDCYALAIQEILKLYEVSPLGNRKHVWESFPDQIHQIMTPLLSSRYTLNCRLSPIQIYPIFGSHLATTFADWIHIWSGQLVCMVSEEIIFEVLQTVHPSMKRDQRILLCFMPYVLLHAVLNSSNTDLIANEILSVIGLESFNQEIKKSVDIPDRRFLRTISMTPKIIAFIAEEGTQMKCSKMVYSLLDFLNRWIREWRHSKKNPTLEDNYKKIDSFMSQFCKLTIAKGNFMCGDYERSLSYLELYIEESQDRLQDQLSFLAEIYSVLDEPDCVAGIMSMKQVEPSISELILAHEVTGRVQDAATCYERLAQEGSLGDKGLQGMVECYLGLDQPFTAHRLLLDQKDLLDGCDDTFVELAAEPLWRLGMFEELDKLVEKSTSPQRSWGVLLGRALLAFRSRDAAQLPLRLEESRLLLLSGMGGTSAAETAAEDGALRRCYPAVLGLHVVAEIEHANNTLNMLTELADGDKNAADILETFLNDWDIRLQVVQSSVRTVEPLLRMRRILLEQSKTLLESTHPQFASLFDVHIGNLWLQSAKYARKAGIFQQAYIYLLNAEKYNPDCLFIQKAKLYWERGQQESAFTTLKRGLEEKFSNTESLNQQQSKICAKAKLLIAVYNDKTTNVDLDVNILHYKEAVDVYRHWEKSLVCLASYYERVIMNTNPNSHNLSNIRTHALTCYGRALLYGHRFLYQSMPRMLSIWLDFELSSGDPSSSMTALTHMCAVIESFVERLPLHLFLTAFSQIVSRICHPVKEVYIQIRAIIVKLIVAYPQHSLWMMMCVIKSSYPQRNKKCADVLSDSRLKEPLIMKLIYDFNQLAEKLIELCNKPLAGNAPTASVSALVRTLPRLLRSADFSHIMMPFEQFCKIVLPTRSNDQVKMDFTSTEPLVYIADVEDKITILPSLQKPRKVTLRGSDGKSYVIMLKPKDDLRKDFRLMEFNAVVNRYLQENPEARSRRLYIRTYSVLPLNEECGLIQWVNNLVGFRPIVIHIYKQRGIFTTNRELRELMCQNKDPTSKKKSLFEEQLLPRHPPVFSEWFRRTFSDPYCWYQARSAYIRTTAVMSMVGYILGLGDRHGENILFDSTNGDTVHVDFNCLFNKGEAFEWPERVPFRLTHNMESAMGPLGREGMFRKSCEVTMRVLRAQTIPLLSVIRPFLYDPLVSWVKMPRPQAMVQLAERTNERAKEDLGHIEQRLQGMVRTKAKQCSLSLSPEGQVNDLIVEATSIMNLCQMYIGWGPFM